MEEIIINKGKTGQLLELALGMKLSSADLDFEDGELKTNKCDANGKPRETVFITQISAMIDELLAQKKSISDYYKNNIAELSGKIFGHSLEKSKENLCRNLALFMQDNSYVYRRPLDISVVQNRKNSNY